MIHVPDSYADDSFISTIVTSNAYGECFALVITGANPNTVVGQAVSYYGAEYKANTATIPLL